VDLRQITSKPGLSLHHDLSCQATFLSHSAFFIPSSSFTPCFLAVGREVFKILSIVLQGFHIQLLSELIYNLKRHGITEVHVPETNCLCCGTLHCNKQMFGKKNVSYSFHYLVHKKSCTVMYVLHLRANSTN
jgi:hypothetical protein